ncbi:hypothetical protein Plhal304r1_c010g0037921 [Plasmopara halstedii]
MDMLSNALAAPQIDDQEECTFFVCGFCCSLDFAHKIMSVALASYPGALSSLNVVSSRVTQPKIWVRAEYLQYLA